MPEQPGGEGGPVAIVTGGGSGIGRAGAVALALVVRIHDAYGTTEEDAIAAQDPMDE